MQRTQAIRCRLTEELCFDPDCSTSICQSARRDAAERVLYEIANEQSAAAKQAMRLPLSDRKTHIASILASSSYAAKLSRHLDDVLAGWPSAYNLREELVDAMALKIKIEL